MSAADLNLAGPLREALIAEAAITALLGDWSGEPSIHTRRPVPDDAGYPLIVVGPPAAIGNFDGLRARRPVPLPDVIAYGRQPDQYRAVETLGYLVRGLFHENRAALVVPNYRVIRITASGPHPAPTDDEKLVARAVSLSVWLEALA